MKLIVLCARLKVGLLGSVDAQGSFTAVSLRPKASSYQLATGRATSLAQIDAQRLVIRAANWVGDAVLTTPAIRAIRRSFPRAHISLLAKPWVGPLFRHNPHVDQILPYHDHGRHKGLLGKLRLARDLRRHRFDMAVLIQNAFEAALVAFLAGIPYRLGYSTDGRRLLLRPPIPVNPALKKAHVIDYYLGIVHGAGWATDGRDLDLFISADQRRRAAELLRRHGAPMVKDLIGVSPGAEGGLAKRWPPECFAELCAQLKTATGRPVVLFGSAKEVELGRQVATRAGRGVCINLCGHTSLEEAVAAMATLALFVSNDSGLMHVAAALRIPQVAIIGPTDPAVTGPSNPNSRLVQAPVPCSPCKHRKRCPTDHQCMTAITLAQVYPAALAVLTTAGAGTIR